MTHIIEYLLNGLISLFGSIFETIFEAIGDLAKPPKSHKHSADFDPPEAQYQKSGGGFRIGFAWGNTMHDSFSHSIVFGGSGSKKSTCIGFPTILQSTNCSYVIFDPAGEYLKTASYLNSLNDAIDVLDFDQPERSIGFNALDKCKNETDDYKVAQVLSRSANEGSAYDYWAQSSENLIGFCISVLRKFAPPEYVNLPNVLHMIQVFSYDAPSIDGWIARNADEKTMSKYKSIVATPEKTLLSSVATALNTLQIYGNPAIAAITAKDTLPFEKFRTEKRALFICGSPSIMRYTRGVSSCFFEMFFSHILQKLPEAGTLPIRFIIDECASMNLAGSLPKILELGRKFNISIATLWQDYNQIEHIYGKNEASNIMSNSRLKIYMPSGQPLATCTMLQELLGRYTYTDKNGIDRTRELLTAQEIFQLKKILVLNGNLRPVLLDPKPYFESKKLLSYTDMPPYTIPHSGLTENVPLLNFEQ